MTTQQHVENRVRRELQTLEKRLSPDDFDTLQQFLETLSPNVRTRLNYLNVLDSFTRAGARPLHSVTEREVRRWLSGLKR